MVSFQRKTGGGQVIGREVGVGEAGLEDSCVELGEDERGGAAEEGKKRLEAVMRQRCVAMELGEVVVV